MLEILLMGIIRNRPIQLYSLKYIKGLMQTQHVIDAYPHIDGNNNLFYFRKS